MAIEGCFYEVTALLPDGSNRKIHSLILHNSSRFMHSKMNLVIINKEGTSQHEIGEVDLAPKSTIRIDIRNTGWDLTTGDCVCDIDKKGRIKTQWIVPESSTIATSSTSYSQQPTNGNKKRSATVIQNEINMVSRELNNLQMEYNRRNPPYPPPPPVPNPYTNYPYGYPYGPPPVPPRQTPSSYDYFLARRIGELEAKLRQLNRELSAVL